ncbi:MAG: DUF493 domain-containing protein [Thermodesulfobacteriota bacterium]
MIGFPRPLTCKSKAKIDYPCDWLYKVIGQNNEALIEAITSVCGTDGVKISPSNSSSGGKYCSFNVEMVVMDEQSRLRVYEELKKHQAVKVIL